MVDSSDIERIIAEVEKENALFGEKGCLDPLKPASAIVGREDKAKELVRFLVGGLAKGHAVPFISVYGRSGSGKFTLTRFVCKNLQEGRHIVKYAFVNLRMARTVFGCACAILSKLACDGADIRHGTDYVMGKISEAIGSTLTDGKLFVLVLDEFDALFSDRRGRASDLVYRLLEMQEKLRQPGRLMTIVAISNSAMSGHDILDDRVRSRMGSAAEISFGAYSKDDVLLLLREKANQASVDCDPGVLEYCAQVCSDEHGDARRAIELFRAAGEVAGLQGCKKIQTAHVDAAELQLQKDRVAAAVAGSSYHMRIACAALARVTYLTGQEWHSTSVLYNQYCMMLRNQAKPLTYRRVSEILGELVNAGLATSATMSWGRPGGYGTRYRLTMPPDLVGRVCLPEWWKEIEAKKRKHDEEAKQSGQRRFEAAMGQSLQDSFYSKPRILTFRNMEEQEKAEWKKFVGVE